jgi:hypothetical protein
MNDRAKRIWFYYTEIVILTLYYRRIYKQVAQD